MVVCPNCLSQIQEDSIECPTCGQAFCHACFEPLAIGTAFCAECGEEVLVPCDTCQSMIAGSARYCTECGKAIAETGPILVPEYTRIRRDSGHETEESFTGICPQCTSKLYIQDGFCSECGQALCTACGHALADDDDRCPACGAELFFSCPLCDFKLIAGTEICPNCEALFPTICAHCGNEIRAKDRRCQSCQHPVSIEARQSARTIRTFLVGRQLVRMIACPGCGRHANPATGPCTRCGTQVCAECQTILIANEKFCPRCGKLASVASLGTNLSDPF